jgi:DNA replication and repair protein RecF
MPRSFRPGRFSTWVRDGQEEGSVQCVVEDSGREHRIELFLENGKRKYSLNGNRVAGVHEVSEVLKLVFFGPEDLRLVKGGPSERRGFMDRAIYRAAPSHLKLIQDYQKTMRERNALLAQYPRGRLPSGLLESFEEQLVHLGCRICSERARYVSALVREVDEYWRALEPITGGSLQVIYSGGYGIDAEQWVTGDEELEGTAMDNLRELRGRDLERATTGAGPHLDDLTILFGGQAARDRASQGQTRSLVAALRIGEMLEWKRNHDVTPILMMDDLSSELDQEHYKVVMEAIEGKAEQVILTTTTPEYVINDRHARLFQVSGGEVLTERNLEG